VVNKGREADGMMIKNVFVLYDRLKLGLISGEKEEDNVEK